VNYKSSSFEIIEQRRVMLGISYYRLCKLAGIHQTTYYRASKGLCKANVATCQKLEEALDHFLCKDAYELQISGVKS
jgi:predicted transcriptional regulator